MLVSSMLYVLLKTGSRFPHVDSFFVPQLGDVSKSLALLSLSKPGSAFATVARRS